MHNSVDYIRERLLALADEKYKDFQCPLIPTVERESVIGVRTPAVRALAKELHGSECAREFMRSLPHRYYEENNLHAFLIEHIREYGECVAATDAFLPYVDNWATCDSMSPKVFKKHLPTLLERIELWLASDRTYTVRFGMGMLMRFYLDEAFDVKYPALVAAVRSEEYYVRMMAAWYFATALAKQYDAVLPFIEQHRLDEWTHNKAIQKSIESYRISDERKAYLRSLKI